MSKPKIIVFEGVDRSGKDAMIERLSDKLTAKYDFDVGIYRNPDHPVRNLLLSPSTNLNEIENLLVFYSGYLNTDRYIMEDNPDVALVNRRVLSSLVYQKLNTKISPLQMGLLQQYHSLLPVEQIVFLNIGESELKKRCSNVELDQSRFEENNQAIINRRKEYIEQVSYAKNKLSHLFNWDKIQEYTNNTFQDQERIINRLTHLLKP